MFLEILGENENIVHVDDDVSFVNEIFQNSIHHGLERGGRIGESEEHDCRLKAASISGKGSFPFVSFLDAKIVVSPPKIHLGEEFRTTEFVDEFENKGKGIIVLNGVRVKIAIILARSQASAVRFRNIKERRSLWRLRWTNVAFSEIFI